MPVLIVASACLLVLLLTVYVEYRQLRGYQEFTYTVTYDDDPEP